MKWIKRIFRGFYNMYMVWKYPVTLNESLLKINQDLFNFFMKVQEENKPYFSRFGLITTDDEEKPIITIWAAPGSNSSPEKRIKELLEENQSLRAQIDSMLIKKEAEQ